MNSGKTNSIATTLDEAPAALDFEQVFRSYWEQDEIVLIKGFLPLRHLVSHPDLTGKILS